MDFKAKKTCKKLMNAKTRLIGKSKKEKVFTAIPGKRGQQMIVGLMFFVITLLMLAGFTPLINGVINIQKGSDNLNCAGYIDTSSNRYTTSNLSYDPNKNTDSFSCMLLKIQVAYLIIAVMVGGIASILYGRATAPQSPYG